MRKNKFLAALAIAACLATSVPLSANAATVGQAADASKVTYGVVSDADKAEILKAFDAANYAKENPDVAALFSGDALFNHFITAGIFEGRGLNADFNVSAYYSAYGDLQTKIGKDPVKLTMHYLTHGKNENRKLISVKAVTEAGIDVVSLFDGSVVAKGVVAPAPTGGSSEPSGNTDPGNTDPEKTVTDASAEKIAKLQKELDKYKTDLDKAKDDLKQLQKDYEDAKDQILTDEEKQKLEDKYKEDYETAKGKADKLQEKVDELQEKVDDYKNAQGDKTEHAKSEANKYNPENVKTATTLAADIPTTTLAAITDGATELKFRNNVWYNYSDGKFYAPKKISGKGGYTGAQLVLKDGYTQIGGQYYELYSLSPYKVLPYMINVGGIADSYIWTNWVDIDGTKRDQEVDPAWRGDNAVDVNWDNATRGTLTAEESNRILYNTGADKAVVPYYVNANGTKKYMEITSGAVVDTKWADQKGYFNILGEYTTVNPMTFDANDGKLSDYWVNVDGKYYVVVSEMTTYLDKSGDWNYIRDQWGNPEYIHVGGMAPNNQNGEYNIPGPGASDVEGFIELNTDKDEHLQVVRSPYLREKEKDNLDAYQYSMRFVSNVNAVVSDFATDEEKELAEWQQNHWYLYDQLGYEVFDSVTSGSITEGSYGSLQNFYAQEWTRFESQDEALRAWYNVHYVYGSQSALLADIRAFLGLPVTATNKEIVDGLIADGSADAMRFFRYLHVDEYYEEIKPDDGYILCLGDKDGFAVADPDGDGVYERIDGSRFGIAEDEVRVRAFQYIPTSEYKKATSQNLQEFHYNAAAGKYYVDTEYEGAVWYNDGGSNMAFADGARPVSDPRWADFVALGFYANWAHRNADAEPVPATAVARDLFLHDEDADGNPANGEGYANRSVALAGTDDVLAANYKWLDETGLVIDQDRLDRLKGSTNNKHGYVYVHVVIYDYNEVTNTFVVDPAIGAAGQDRWYKATDSISADRPTDALYDPNTKEWYYKKPVRESVATVIIPGGYGLDTEGIREEEVTTLADAFDLADINYPLFTVVQARENGRFYAVRDYSKVAPHR
jgi:hypothetical protein